MFEDEQKKKNNEKYERVENRDYERRYQERYNQRTVPLNRPRYEEVKPYRSHERSYEERPTERPYSSSNDRKRSYEETRPRSPKRLKYEDKRLKAFHLPPQMTEEEIKKEFEIFGNVISIEFSEKDSRIAVVEYENEKDAFVAKNKMNGMILGDSKLDVIFNIKTPDKEKQVYVGGLHYDVKERDLDQIFQDYGNVISVVLVPNKETGKHKGYGFVEFESKESVVKSCDALNGKEFYGRNIRVNPVGKIIEPKREESNQSNNYPRDNTVGKSYIAMQRLIRSKDENPTRCILLMNLVTPEEVDKRLEEEIRYECSKYGIIEKLVIYPEKYQVKIFVLYKSPEMATLAQGKLDHRYFDGRSVKCYYYDEKDFQERKFEKEGN